MVGVYYVQTRRLTKKSTATRGAACQCDIDVVAVWRLDRWAAWYPYLGVTRLSVLVTVYSSDSSVKVDFLGPFVRPKPNEPASPRFVRKETERQLLSKADTRSDRRRSVQRTRSVPEFLRALPLACAFGLTH